MEYTEPCGSNDETASPVHPLPLAGDITKYAHVSDKISCASGTRRGVKMGLAPSSRQRAKRTLPNEQSQRAANKSIRSSQDQVDAIKKVIDP
jgi:hypothetical protein